MKMPRPIFRPTPQVTNMDRRRFLASAAAGTVALGPATQPTTAVATDASDPCFHEPAREVPIVEDLDVVVCGSGPAGVAAAIAAARSGATTRLIEVNGCLGGIWTSGMLSIVLDFNNKTGLMQEIRQRLQARNARLDYDSGHFVYDCEAMKVLLETLCVDAGVRIRLHTRVVGAAVDDDRRVQLAVTESKSGREAFQAKVFVDATGDGDLSVQAGCGFDFGRPGSGLGQPMSLIALVTGLDAQQAWPFVRGLAEPRGERQPKQRLLEELRRAGVEPSYSAPSLFYLSSALFCLVVNHEYRVSGTDANDVTDATLRGRAEINRCVDALRQLGGIWSELQLVGTAEHIGVRESRRIHGLYEVTEMDLIRGTRHDDAVCKVSFGVDVHSPDPDKSKGFDHGSVRARQYHIPYRSLLPKDARRLLVAGRCISGDFIAHSSYRVTGNSVATGEAAGVAAALAARQGVDPRDLPWAEIRTQLGKIAPANPPTTTSIKTHSTTPS